MGRSVGHVVNSICTCTCAGNRRSGNGGKWDASLAWAAASEPAQIRLTRAFLLHVAQGVGSPTELGVEGREEHPSPRSNVHKRHHQEQLEQRQQQQQGGEEGGMDGDGDMEMADQEEAQRQHQQGEHDERQQEQEGEVRDGVTRTPQRGAAAPYGIVDEGAGGDVCMEQQQPGVGACGHAAHGDKGVAHRGGGPMVGVVAQEDGAADEECDEGEEEWGGAGGSEDEADSGGSVGVEYRQAGKRGWGGCLRRGGG